MPRYEEPIPRMESLAAMMPPRSSSWAGPSPSLVGSTAGSRPWSGTTLNHSCSSAHGPLARGGSARRPPLCPTAGWVAVRKAPRWSHNGNVRKMVEILEGIARDEKVSAIARSAIRTTPTSIRRRDRGRTLLAPSGLRRAFARTPLPREGCRSVRRGSGRRHPGSAALSHVRPWPQPTDSRPAPASAISSSASPAS